MRFQSFPFSQEYFHIYLVDKKNLKIAERLYERNDLRNVNLENRSCGFVYLYRINEKVFCWNSKTDTTICVDGKKISKMK